MDRRARINCQISRILAAGLLTAGTSVCFAQDVTLALSSAPGRPGFGVILSLTLNHTGRDSPASVQWTIHYSVRDFTALTLSPGPAAENKFLSCVQRAGSATCILWGLNSTSIPDGVVANVSLTISPFTKDSSSQIQVDGGESADPSGISIPTTGMGGTVTIILPNPGMYAEPSPPAQSQVIERPTLFIALHESPMRSAASGVRARGAETKRWHPAGRSDPSVVSRARVVMPPVPWKTAVAPPMALEAVPTLSCMRRRM